MSEARIPIPAAADSLPDIVNQNIDSMAAYHQREQEKVGKSQRRLEAVADFISRPVYLISLCTLIVLWIAMNILARDLHFVPWDPPPFSWLQGVLTLAAMLTATVVVITQNRQATLAKQRAHLDLQVNLLTEQKVTKLIHLIEELRRDLPMVRDRHDPEAAALQERTETAQVLSAIQSVESQGDSASGKPP